MAAYIQAAQAFSQIADTFMGAKKSGSGNSSNNMTEQTEVDAEKATALLKSLLEGKDGVAGLAAIAGAQKTTGMYNSTTNQQLTNDLLSRSTASIAELGSKKTVTSNSTTASNDSSKRQWVICTELVKQGRMPREYYIPGARVFAAYTPQQKRGYFVWAIPSVKHLKAKPHSLYSRFMCAVFNLRAETIAAKAGVEGAKYAFLGKLIEAIGKPACGAIGYFVKETTYDNAQLYILATGD